MATGPTQSNTSSAMHPLIHAVIQGESSGRELEALSGDDAQLLLDQLAAGRVVCGHLCARRLDAGPARVCAEGESFMTGDDCGAGLCRTGCACFDHSIQVHFTLYAQPLFVKKQALLRNTYG